MKKIILGILMVVSFYSNAQTDTLDLSTYYSNITDTKKLKAFSKPFENKQTFRVLRITMVIFIR